jgi:diguanylate cyclase (GGDEF)-like protein
MLSVPTLWLVFVVNFLAMGLLWAYVGRSYPNFEAARHWTAAAFAAAAGAVLGMTRQFVDSSVPLLLAGTLIVLACCLCLMGIRSFYGRSADWRTTLLITGLSFAGLSVFLLIYDSSVMRAVIYTIGQSIPAAMTLPLVLSRQDSRPQPGARLAGLMAACIIAINIIRGAAAILHIGVGSPFVHFDAFQGLLTLVLVFFSMAWNFGFLLMAIDRLRNEVADLALMDDLTGVANRRQLLRRLEEACVISHRSGEPFALLVIDLDGFKQINDTHGHAAGDACLQHFTLMAQMQLRPGDLLARTGGDEFCIVLPDTTLREGAMIARRVLAACHDDAVGCVGADIPIAASIGVAQWTRDIGLHSERLMAAADHALYAAKNEGKNRYAVYDPAPPIVPDLPLGQEPMRQTA